MAGTTRVRSAIVRATSDRGFAQLIEGRLATVRGSEEFESKLIHKPKVRRRNLAQQRQRETLNVLVCSLNEAAQHWERLLPKRGETETKLFFGYHRGRSQARPLFFSATHLR